MKLGEQEMGESWGSSDAAVGKEEGWNRESRGGLGIALSIGLVVTLMITAGSARASSSAGPQVCGCSCYHDCGGGCPSGTTLGLTASTQAEATNVTLSWYPSTADLYGTWANVTFGNSTAYHFYAVNDSFGSGDSGSGVFIDYLQPSTVYYYKIVAWGYCISTPNSYYHQTYTGTWTTSLDAMSTISGRVVDVNGTAAPSWMEVWIRCAGSQSLGNYWPQTSGTGYYSSGNLGSGYQLNCANDGGYAVTAMTEPNVGGNYASWLGHWNETIVVWAPQWLNFGLPTATATWLPMSAAFVNNNGRAIQSGSYYLSSQYSKSWDGASQSSDVQFAESGNFTYPVNQNVIDLGLYQTTGVLMMNAVTNRTPYIGGIQYWGAQLKSIDNPTYTSDPDSLANFNPTNCYGTYKINKPAGTWWNGSATVGGSITNTEQAGTYLTWGVGAGIGLDFGLDGGIGIAAGVEVTFTVVDTSESVTISQSADWGWNVHYASSGEFYSVCFDTSGPGNTEVMHIYESSS